MTLELDCAIQWGQALKDIKEAVKKNPCNVKGAFQLRADVIKILSEVDNIG